MEHVFFNGWTGPARTFVIGIGAYIMLVAFLRVSGKRTLSKMNAFDFLVTVALGSTLASILLTQDVTLLQGGIAFAVLIGLQYVVTWTSVRSGWIRRAVTGEPTLLLLSGKLLEDAMRRTRVTEGELRAAVRGAGLRAFDEAEAIVLETDASFSVIPRRSDSGAEISSLRDVRGYSQHTPKDPGAPRPHNDDFPTSR